MTTQHDCVEKFNELVKPSNTKLASVIEFGDSSFEKIILLTEKADPKNRAKPKLVFASYCPMCGISLKGSK